MKKLCIVILSGLSFVYGCVGKENEAWNQKQVNYPKSIDDIDLHTHYDNALWALYQHYFDQDTLSCRNRQKNLSEKVVGILNLHPRVREIEIHKRFLVMNITLETDSCGYCLPVNPKEDGSLVDIFIFYGEFKKPILRGYSGFTYKKFMDSLAIHFYRQDSMWYVMENEYYRIGKEDAKRELLFQKYLLEHRVEVEKNEWLYRLARERGIYALKNKVTSLSP